MSATTELLGKMAGAWLVRLQSENGPLDERVYLPLMAITSDIRYMEMIGQQRQATRKRWAARARFAWAGIRWVAP